MEYRKFSEKNFQSSPVWAAIQEVSKDHGLYPYLFSFYPDSEVAKNAGVYLIVSPNGRYFDDLYKNPAYLNKLLEDKRLMGRHSFNPLYNIFKIDEYEGWDKFQVVSDIISGIKMQGIAVNAFYECGYMDLPETIHETTISAIEDLDMKRTDASMPANYRTNYDKAYKKLVTSAYQKTKEVSMDRLVPASKKQLVSPSLFEEKRIDTSHAPINAKFREYFEKRVKDFPDFYYCYSKKPTLHLKDISEMFKGPASQNRWITQSEYTEWEITYPACYENIYYRIGLEYNTEGLLGAKTKLYQIGEAGDLRLMHIPWDDIFEFDKRCKEAGIKYYIGRGEIEEISADSLEKIAIAVNVMDGEKISDITNNMYKEMVHSVAVDPDKVRQMKQKAIEHKVDLIPNRGLQSFKGLGIEEREM